MLQQRVRSVCKKNDLVIEIKFNAWMAFQNGIISVLTYGNQRVILAFLFLRS